MRALKDAIARIAPIPSPVLIRRRERHPARSWWLGTSIGSSGHAREPFIAVNCAALPEQLVESELFGHERGAFTGAQTTAKGRVRERGSGHALFWTRSASLPLAAQAKLLRVLEDRQVVRLGSSRAIDVPARVIAATNRDLAAEVAADRFRRDLLFRLERARAASCRRFGTGCRIFPRSWSGC